MLLRSLFFSIVLPAALDIISSVFAQSAEQCVNSAPCKNGGKCSLASPTFLPAQCKDDESYFNGNCFHVYENPLSWDKAEKTCAARAAHLVSLKSPRIREWMTNLISMKKATLSRALRSIGFWTAGHSVLNGTQPVFVWMPDHHLIRDFHWYYGEPNIYENNSDICIVLRAESDYRAWHSQLCSDLNFFVCARDSGEDRLWNVQCECPVGFKGRYCEVDESVKEVPLIAQAQVCPKERFEFSCITGGVINVDYAFYGNDGTSSPQCTQQGYRRVEQEVCSDPFALVTLTQRCQGLRYCQAKTVQSMFSQSVCTKGILSYRLRCSDEPLTKCPKGTNYIQGRCYSVVYHANVGARLSWARARKDCHSKGGDLAGPVNRNVDNLLRIEMARKNTSQTGYWIGFQIESANSSVWINGLSVGEFVPSNSLFVEQVGCGYYISSSQSHVWSSDHCDSRKNWVCEFSPLDDKSRETEALPKDFGESPVFVGTSPLTDGNDLFGDGPFCPEVTWNSLHFPKTRACAEAVVSCPNKEEVDGFVSYKCNCETGTWAAKPDTNNCTHKWIGELSSAVERGDPALPIAQNLAKELSPDSSRPFYGGDVVGSVDIHAQLIPLAQQQLDEDEDDAHRQEQANNITKLIGMSGDYLLDSKFREIWNGLDRTVRIKKASTLMRTLEQSAILLATFIAGNEEKLDYANWAMEIEVHRPNFVDDEFGRGLPNSIVPFSGPADVPAGPPMDAPVEGPPVTFDRYSKSPIIRLPSFSVLQSSRLPPKNVMNEPFLFAASPARTAPLDRNPLRLGYYLFTSIGSLLTSDNHTIVNSHVIGASVNDPTQSVSLPESAPATFTFYHLKKKGVANPRCVFWDANTMLWSENGCTLIQTNDNFTDCSCNHLTSFAILMDITGSLEEALTGTAAVALDFITIIGCALSIICLAMSVLVFSCFRSLWNVRNTIHRNLCITLLVAELLFVIGINRSEDADVCRGIAIALHYFFLSAFTWMLLEGYQLYLMLIQVFQPDKTRIIVYYIIGYGVSAVVVAISAGISWEHYGTSNYCWIDVRTPTIWAFVAPITVVIVINVVFLFIALKVILSVRSRDRTTSQRVAGWLKGSATLLCLLGLTWIFGYLVAVSTAEPAFAYIFTILNTLQGLLIFVLHVVLNDKVRVTLVRFLRRSFCCAQDPTSSYNSKSYISSKQRLLNLLRPKDKDSQQSTSSSSNSQGTTSAQERSALDSEKQMSSTEEKRIVVTLEASITAKSDQTRHNTEIASKRRSERQRTAPVRRKKFPLGATEDDRIGDNKETVFIERF